MSEDAYCMLRVTQSQDHSSDSTSVYPRNIHLQVSQTLKEIVTATQAKRLIMKWHLSCEESVLLNLYKRQGAVFMAQASSYVTIRAIGSLKESERSQRATILQ